MPDVEFTVADAVHDRAALISLNLEYVSWVFGEIETHFAVPMNGIAGVPVGEYVPAVIDKVCGDLPPKGIFYLVHVDRGLAGMGGCAICAQVQRKSNAFISARNTEATSWENRCSDACCQTRVCSDMGTCSWTLHLS